MERSVPKAATSACLGHSHQTPRREGPRPLPSLGLLKGANGWGGDGAAWPQEADHTRALHRLGAPQQGGGSNVLTTDRGRRAAPRIWLKITAHAATAAARRGQGKALQLDRPSWQGGLLLAAGAVDQPFKASISCLQRASPLVQLTLPARPQEPYQEVCQAWAPFQFRSWPRPSVSAEINQQSHRSRSVGPLSAGSSPRSCGTAEQAGCWEDSPPRPGRPGRHLPAGAGPPR